MVHAFCGSLEESQIRQILDRFLTQLIKMFPDEGFEKVTYIVNVVTAMDQATRVEYKCGYAYIHFSDFRAVHILLGQTISGEPRTYSVPNPEHTAWKRRMELGYTEAVDESALASILTQEDAAKAINQSVDDLVATDDLENQNDPFGDVPVVNSTLLGDTDTWGQNDWSAAIEQSEQDEEEERRLEELHRQAEFSRLQQEPPKTVEKDLPPLIELLPVEYLPGQRDEAFVIMKRNYDDKKTMEKALMAEPTLSDIPKAGFLTVGKVTTWVLSKSDRNTLTILTPSWVDQASVTAKYSRYSSVQKPQVIKRPNGKMETVTYPIIHSTKENQYWRLWEIEYQEATGYIDSEAAYRMCRKTRFEKTLPDGRALKSLSFPARKGTKDDASLNPLPEGPNINRNRNNDKRRDNRDGDKYKDRRDNYQERDFATLRKPNAGSGATPSYPINAPSRPPGPLDWSIIASRTPPALKKTSPEPAAIEVLPPMVEPVPIPITPPVEPVAIIGSNDPVPIVETAMATMRGVVKDDSSDDEDDVDLTTIVRSKAPVKAVSLVKGRSVRR